MQDLAPTAFITMLEKIKFLNFQAFDKLEIEFDKHITCLVGCSDAGKSSILRMIQWIATNQPSGESFILRTESGRADNCIGRLVVDGHTVKRVRGKKGNTYSLDGKKFKAFGGKVPDSVKALLNVSSVNFQNQIDPPYWFDLSPGQVSRELNKIVDMEEIDELLKLVGSEVKGAKSRVEVSADRLQQVRQARRSWNWAVKADKQLTALEDLDKQHTEITEDVEILSEMVETLTSNGHRLETLRETVSRWDKVSRGLGKYFELGTEITELQQLTQELRDFKQITIPNFTPVERLRSEADKVAEETRELSGEIDELVKLESELCHARQELVKTKAQLAQMGLVTCPTCGAQTEPDRLQLPSETSTSPSKPLTLGRLSRTGSGSS